MEGWKSFTGMWLFNERSFSFCWYVIFNKGLRAFNWWFAWINQFAMTSSSPTLDENSMFVIKCYKYIQFLASNLHMKRRSWFGDLCVNHSWWHALLIFLISVWIFVRIKIKICTLRPFTLKIQSIWSRKSVTFSSMSVGRWMPLTCVSQWSDFFLVMDNKSHQDSDLHASYPFQTPFLALFCLFMTLSNALGFLSVNIWLIFKNYCAKVLLEINANQI